MKNKLIKRFLSGGLIPKFLEPWRAMTRNEWNRRIITDGTYANRKLNTAWKGNDGYTYRAVVDKNKNVNVYRWKGRANDPQYGTEARKKMGNPYTFIDTKGNAYRPLGNGLYEYEDGSIGMYGDRNGNYVTPNHFLNASRGSGYRGAAGKDNNILVYNDKTGNWDKENSEPINTNNIEIQVPIDRPNITSRNSRRNSRTINTPLTYDSPIDLTSMTEALLKARNDAMTRGWGSYVYNGLTYNFTGDDLTNARNNWRINRGKLNSSANGLLGLSTTNTPVEQPYTEKMEEDRMLESKLTLPLNKIDVEPTQNILSDGLYGALSTKNSIPLSTVSGQAYARRIGQNGLGRYTPNTYNLYANNDSRYALNNWEEIRRKWNI